MGVIQTNNQISQNSRTKKRCSDFESLEKEFQDAQNHFEQFNDKKSWDIMWIRIQHAVFNTLNKKLENVMSRDEIEEKSTEITCNIARSILNKRKAGMHWKIQKLSSAVYLPCFVIYSEKLKFYDELLDETSFRKFDKDGFLTVEEFEDSYLKDGILVQHLSIKDDIQKDEKEGMDFESAFSIMQERHQIQLDSIFQVITIIEEHGADYKKFCSDEQKRIAYILINLLKGERDE